MNKKGFTLIELMVIIVIIGILAAIVVPKMFGMNAKARFFSDREYTGVQKEVCLEYYNNNSSNERFKEKVFKKEYRCSDYIKRNNFDIAEEAPIVNSTPKSNESIHTMFLSGNFTTDERNYCFAHMQKAMSDDDRWNSAKGEYAFYTGLIEHIDDCPDYAKHFPSSCKFRLAKNGKLVC